MSRFAYKAEGELNSQYVLDMLKEYLSQLLLSNDTKGIEENDYKINTNANRLVRWFKDATKRLFKNKESLENYNKVLSVKYTASIMDKIDIFLQNNVLTAKQVFDLKQILQAINFNAVIPMIDEYRERAIKSNQKQFLKVLKDIKYLKHAHTNYILYNSPVNELKPFLSDKVTNHQVNYCEIQKLVKQFVNLRYNELTISTFDSNEIEFITQSEDLYKESITDNGVGEEVEQFIRSKMLEKLEILKHEERLKEDLDNQVNQIDILLKKLKVYKIEKMLQDLIKLKTNLAKAKEVMDSCKDTINASTIPNKAQIFLVMDNLYYKLSKKCENLQQKTKLKLQLVDKQKMFDALQSLQNQNNVYDDMLDDEILSKADVNTTLHSYKMRGNTVLEEDQTINEEVKPHIASNLYDDDETDEIHISEDDDDSYAEDEIVIDEDDEQ